VLALEIFFSLFRNMPILRNPFQTGSSQWLEHIQDPAFFEAIGRLIKRFFSAKNAGIVA